MGETMNLMAPADSFETARGVIDSGTDEVYLGLDDRNFVNLNLPGRGRGCNVSMPRTGLSSIAICVGG